MMIETRQSLLFGKMLEAAPAVDFDNKDDATGFATLIFAVANELGILTSKGTLQSAESLKTIQYAKEWVYNIKARLGSKSAGDALDLLEPYDFMHRLGYKSPISKTFEYEYVMKAFEARIHGDKTVNEYHLYRKIRSELYRKNKPYFDRPLRWYSVSLDRWYKIFKYGQSLEKLSDYDTLQIVSILMSDDLFVFTDSDQNKFKKKLYDNHRELLNRIGEYGYEELAALTQFLLQSCSFMSPGKYHEYDTAITHAMITNPATNPCYRLTLQQCGQSH